MSHSNLQANERRKNYKSLSRAFDIYVYTCSSTRINFSWNFRNIPISEYWAGRRL